jgi:para-aminobenzoate synthetase / 4-amino-4-deoxychorismate lyase
MTFQFLTDSALQSLLAALQDEQQFVFLETTRPNAENRRSLLFRQPVASLRLWSSQPPARFFAQLEDYLAKGYYLAGWCAYELGYLLEPALARNYQPPRPILLADLGVYTQPHIYDHLTGDYAGAGSWPQDPGQPAAAYQLDCLRLNQSREAYLATIERIKGFIRAGDSYQVNYTLKLLFDFTGSAAAFYRALRRGQSVSYGAYLRNGDHRIMSFSPELFFRKSSTCCTVRPMKGTIRRGWTEDEDAGLAAFLRNDEKNRSENIMIVDLLRNDLGRLCRMGSVSVPALFQVESFESLHQMTSTIRGELRPQVTPAELFQALFPCGSVTGAPKIRTMEIIRALELAPRGVYTGAIGYFSPGGEAVFSVPIRTVVLAGRQGEMGIGSGIVADSEPQNEWEECHLKSRFLTSPQPEFELIETMVWLPGEGYWLLDLHLERLLTAARRFGFTAAGERINLYLEELSGQFAEAPHRVRLTLAKDGRLAARFTPCPPPVRQMVPRGCGELPRICFSPHPVDSRDGLRYYKTTWRELFDREREKAVAAGYFEVLFRNERGEVTEGSITNLFVRKGDRLLTPPVSCGLLDGVFRRHFLATSPVPLVEEVLGPADLHLADAVYVANSVRGLVQVVLTDGSHGSRCP